MIQSTSFTRSRLDVTALDRLIPAPRLQQIDHVDVGAPQARTWDAVRQLDFASAPLVRALFALRTIPTRLRGGRAETMRMRIDDITKSRHGFRILEETSGSSIAVGAIGKVWQPDIEFADLGDAPSFAAFDAPGWVKVAWELRSEPRGENVTRVVLELRVAATDGDAWRRFSAYFALIGPFSHFIRRHMLATLAHQLGGPGEAEQAMPLAGDELLPDAVGSATHGITIAARPEVIWPWLVQMGCRRAGWYSWDFLDNAGVPSAREILPEFQAVHVGDMLPATPKGDSSFEVLRIEPPNVLVLGGLYDLDTDRPMRFAAARPVRYWQVTWAFILEPIADATTRLHVRARAALDPHGRGSNARLLIAPLVHHFMETAQLRHLRDRVEGSRAGIS
jgi:hypothetical protein